ncbi:hypothetical protein YC2023_080586 [Brassica napus]
MPRASYYLTFWSLPPYNTASSIARLLNASATEIQSINNLTSLNRHNPHPSLSRHPDHLLLLRRWPLQVPRASNKINGDNASLLKKLNHSNIIRLSKNGSVRERLASLVEQEEGSDMETESGDLSEGVGLLAQLRDAASYPQELGR